MALRAKISSKFTPKVAPNPSKSNKETTKHVPVTIKKAPLPPPLLAKSKKKSMLFRNTSKITKHWWNP